MIELPQHGGCLCGDVRYRLDRDPFLLDMCHCTDCQRQTGASFTLALLVPGDAVTIVRGWLDEYARELADGRRKTSRYCRRCATRILAPSSASELTILEPGTLDDTSWLRPTAHIWTRSAQPWVRIPEDVLRFEKQPRQEDFLAAAREWKEPAELG